MSHIKKVFIISILICMTFLTTGCSLQDFYKKHVFFKKSNIIKADSKYYDLKARSLVRQIYNDSRAYEINRIAVMDLIDVRGNVPILGKFLTNKLASAIAHGGYFAIVQRGELLNAIGILEIDLLDEINTATITRLGELLEVDALIVGNIVDIGTNFDITLVSIDVKTGDIIASASEDIARTQFAVDLMGLL